MSSFNVTESATTQPSTTSVALNKDNHNFSTTLAQLKSQTVIINRALPIVSYSLKRKWPDSARTTTHQIGLPGRDAALIRKVIKPAKPAVND